MRQAATWVGRATVDFHECLQQWKIPLVVRDLFQCLICRLQGLKQRVLFKLRKQQRAPGPSLVVRISLIRNVPGRECPVDIVVHVQTDSDLLQIISTCGCASRATRSLDSGQQERE